MGPNITQCVDLVVTVGKTVNMKKYAKAITHANLDVIFVYPKYIDGELINESRKNMGTELIPANGVLEFPFIEYKKGFKCPRTRA